MHFLEPSPCSVAFVLFLFSSCSTKSSTCSWRILSFGDFPPEFPLLSFQSVKKKMMRYGFFFTVEYYSARTPGRTPWERHSSSSPLGGISHSPNGRRKRMGKMNEISLNFICASFLQSSLWRSFMLGQASIFRVFPFETLSSVTALVSNHSLVSFIYLSHFIRFRTKGYHNFVVSALPSLPKIHLDKRKNAIFNSCVSCCWSTCFC